MPPAPSTKRRFKSPYWDVPPVGFENVTPEKYKSMQAAGQIPHSVVNPSSQILQGTKYAHPDPFEAAKAAAAIINATILKGATKTAPALTRQARRLYVGNIPFNSTESEIIEFFQSMMISTQAGNPVIACQMNLDKNFAFVEFRSVEETTNAIALDGAMCKGQPLRIRRPHDYQPVAGSEPTPAPVPIQVPGLPNIPPSTTPRVLTEVLCLMNMVEASELMDDEEYEDILEDIVDECSKHGIVKSIEIPRPLKSDPEAHVPGLGKVFVEFDSATDAQRAQRNLSGRRFANRLVVTSCFDRDRYKNKEF